MIVSSLYFHKNGVPTEAVIEEIRDGDVEIRYLVENHSFTILPYRKVIQSKFIMTRKNPGQIYAEDSKTLCYIFLPASPLTMLCSSTLVIFSFRHQRQERWLLRNGVPVQKEVIPEKNTRHFARCFKELFILL